MYGCTNLALAGVLIAAALADMADGVLDGPWPLRVLAILSAATLITSGYGLLRDRPWALDALRISALCGLGIALVAVVLLAVAAAVLHGFEPELGLNLELVLELSVALSLALPYLVLYPGSQWLWMRHQRSGGHPAGAARSAEQGPLPNLKPEARPG